MRTPKPTPEDPAVVAAREREQRRAETARTEETQALLMGATQRRLRRTGRLSNAASAASGGNVSLIAPVGTMTPTGSFGGFTPTGGFGGGGMGGDYQTALY
jgi:hypothetical protein